MLLVVSPCLRGEVLLSDHARCRRSRAITAIFNRVPHLFRIYVLCVLHNLAVLKIPYVGEDCVHYALGFLVRPQIPAGDDDGISSVIKLVYLSAVTVPLRGQPGKNVLSYLFHALILPTIRKTRALRPFT